MVQANASQKAGGFVAFFLVGLVGALAVGWFVFPKLLYSTMEQPVAFNHKVHLEEAGMACDECHAYREDGSYRGYPSTEECAECHAEPTGGDTPAEKAIDKFVAEYAQKGKEVPWLTYQYQPDNVYFSHIAHSGFDCTDCHPDIGNSEKSPSYYKNRISGYSKDTMKMWKCEQCHAESGTSNACYVCHK